MRKTLITVIFLMSSFFGVELAHAAPVAKKEVAVSFDRPVRKGDVFECAIKTVRSSRYSLKMPGIEKPSVRLDSVEVFISGRMTVTDVNSVGNLLKFDMSNAVVTGNVNGKHEELRNIDFSGDLSQTPCVFTLKAAPGTPADAKLPSLAPDSPAFRLLSTVFQPAREDTLKDMTGERAVFTHGAFRKMNVSKLVASLNSRKIACSEKDVDGKITYLGNEKVKDVECMKFDVVIQSARVPGYDFRFKASILFPVEKANGPAFRIMRDVTEIVDRRLPADNPFAAGCDAELISKDTSDITMIPAKIIDAPQKAEKKSFWDSLLK